MDRRSFGVLGSEGEHFLRISIANGDDDLAEAMERIAAASADASGMGLRLVVTQAARTSGAGAAPKRLSFRTTM